MCCVLRNKTIHTHIRGSSVDALSHTRHIPSRQGSATHADDVVGGLLMRSARKVHKHTYLITFIVVILSRHLKSHGGRTPRGTQPPPSVDACFAGLCGRGKSWLCKPPHSGACTFGGRGENAWQLNVKSSSATYS